MTAFFDVNEAGFQSIGSASKTTAEEFLKNLQDWTSSSQEFSSNITTLYSSAGNDSEREFVRYLQSLGSKGAQIANDLVHDNTGKLSELASAYEEGGKASADGLITGIQMLPEDARKITEDTVKGVEEAAMEVDLMPAGGQTIDTFVQGVASSSPNLLSLANGLGGQTAAGVASGIANNVYQIEAAMRTAARRAVFAAQSELEIRSPSKKTERLLGKPIDEGIAVGIKKNEFSVTEALEDVTKGIENTRIPNFSQWPAVAGAGFAHQAAANNTTTTTYNINIDGAMVADNPVIRNAVMAIFAEVKRRKNMGTVRGVYA
jgi:hypothetical protein